MKEFMSLREFLLLRDPIIEDRSAIRGCKEAHEFVSLYDIAKASWEAYGEEGPPAGTQVEMLESGHGSGSAFVLGGVYERDDRFFAVEHVERNELIISLVWRKTWFLSMKVI